MAKRLYRSNKEKMLAGVFGGIAEYFDVDVSLLRIGFIFIWAITGIVPMTIAYFLCAIIIPKNVDKS